MKNYSKTELEEAIKSIASTLSKCEKSFEKLAEGTSQHTLMKRRIKAFRISLDLIQGELANCTEADALSVMMGTGMHTDLMWLMGYTGSLERLYHESIILDIAQYLDYMPNLSALMEDPEIARGVFDDHGRILLLPMFNLGGVVPPFTGLVYRHDILGALDKSREYLSFGEFSAILR